MNRPLAAGERRCLAELQEAYSPLSEPELAKTLGLRPTSTARYLRTLRHLRLAVALDGSPRLWVAS